MSMRKLRRMGLEPRCWEALQRKNMHRSKDVLSLTKMELVNTLELEGRVVDDLITSVCKATAPQSRTVAACLETEDTPYLKTGLNGLDTVLKGGLPSGGIVEIVGPAGVGKTQFCLQSCVLAMGGWSGCGAVYIDTESRFNAERLCEIAKQSLPQMFSQEQEAKIQTLADQCIVYSVSDSSQLMSVLENLPEVLIERSVKLIVVDSVANLVRREFSRDSIGSRYAQLGKEAAMLKMLAENFNIPVIVTNQVTTKFGAHGSAANAAEDGEAYLTAALGTSWSHCVNTRLVLERGPAERSLTVAKSPIAPVCTMTFCITASGLELTSGARMHEENFWQHKIAAAPASVPDGDGDPTNALGTD